MADQPIPDNLQASPGSPLRRFLRETLKLGLALGGALVGVAVVLTGLVILYDNHQVSTREEAEQARLEEEEARVAPLRTVKDWPESEMLPQGTVRLQTKWGDGVVMARMTITDVPPGGFVGARSASLTMTFNDADGFEVFRRAVSLTDLTSQYGDDVDDLVGYEWQDRLEVTSEMYARAESWDVLSSGLAPSSKSAAAAPRAITTPPRAAWQDRENWRKLLKGLREHQVRSILGEPTYVDAGPFTYWVYGGRDRFHDPHVSFYQSDGVYSWQEP